MTPSRRRTIWQSRRLENGIRQNEQSNGTEQGIAPDPETSERGQARILGDQADGQGTPEHREPERTPAEPREGVKGLLACPKCGKTGRGLHFHMKACKG